MKNIYIILLFFILTNCAGFEFILKTNSDNSIKNLTKINVTGDNRSQVYILARNIISDNKKNNPKFQLLISSVKEEEATVIKKDATASKFEIKYSISYTLYNLEKNCNIFNKEIVTASNYNSKSAGYSFGTDFSEEESNKNNINKNFTEFISSLNELDNLNSCRN